MGLFSGITNIVKDVVDVAVDVVDVGVDIVGDVYQGVKGTVEGALTGDPVAIASLAAMAYGAYSIYSAYAAAGTTTTAATTTATTTTTTASAGSTGATVAGGTSSAATQAFAEELGKQIVYNPTNAASAAAQAVAEEQVKKMTLTGVLKTVGTAVVPTVASTLLAGDMDSIEIESTASSEVYDITPDISIGAGDTTDDIGGLSTSSGSQAQNIATLGRLTNLRI